MNYPAILSCFPKLTYQRGKRMLDYFSSAEEAFKAEIGEIIRCGWEEGAAFDFIEWREKFNADAFLKALEKEQINAISLGDPLYPRLLSQISDPPLTIFVRGKLPINEQPTIAVVGTRRCSPYGKRMAEELSAELASQGVVIVSGLALGIDGYAHAAALNANGTTIAVLGSGVDQQTIYPASHQLLAKDIIENGGAVISEYPPGFKPTQYSFPARNRVIAGLSLGTLVIEAPTDSGALITAKCSLDYNRDVFCVPHPITSDLGAGGNKFIKLGAKLITSAKEILEDLNIQNIEQIISNNKILPSGPNEAKLIPLLSREPVHIDALTKQSGLDSPTVNSTLTMMEMKGKVRNLGAMMYILK